MELDRVRMRVEGGGQVEEGTAEACCGRRRRAAQGEVREELHGDDG